MDTWKQIRDKSSALDRNKNGETFLVFVDWKSAFDKLSHDILLEKLRPLLTPRCFRILTILLFYSNFSVDGVNVIAVKFGTP